MRAVFLDIETDGLDPDMHVALEIGLSIYDLHHMKCLCEYSSFIHCSERQWVLGSDPSALKINGITFDDVRNAKSSSDICADLCELFLTHEIHKSSSVFICQNPSFDRGFFPQIMSLQTQQELELPYHWLDLSSMYWGRRVDPTKECSGHSIKNTIPLSKDSIAGYLNIPTEEKPHRAINGVRHLISCYRALFDV